MLKFISFLLICTCSNLIASQSTTSDDSSDYFKKKPSIPIINLDNNPELKKHYNKNERRIPTSRSNVRETDENGEEVLGFLAFLTEYDPSPEYLKKQNGEEPKKVDRRNSKRKLRNSSSCFPIRKKKRNKKND